MVRQKMITYFRKASTDEVLVERDKLETGTWIDVRSPIHKEIKFLSETLNIPEEEIRISLDPDEKPRIEIEKEYKMIIIRLPYIDEKNELNITPMAIFILPKCILTISIETTHVLTDFIEHKVKNVFTTKKTRFMLQILKRANYYFQKHLDEVEKKIESTEKTLLKSFKNQEIIELLKFQKSLVYLNTAVVSNDKILEKILSGKILKLYNEDEDILEDIVIENKESIEMVNIYTNILANTTDAYASIISNNLNIVMKFLTSVTIILAIPTIVSSFYGMNVPLPFQHTQFAFQFPFFISILLMGVAIGWFVKKKYF
ncbi:MAG: magnesium transporter CorA family protein [Nanoarchaeota archaeon]|nr:magnesium transporter CorA family protein [Nanoarchaeota archaeon]